jgi:hypothetical protein
MLETDEPMGVVPVACIPRFVGFPAHKFDWGI